MAEQSVLRVKARMKICPITHRLTIDTDQGLGMKLGKRRQVDLVLQVEDGWHLGFLAAPQYYTHQ